MTHSHMPRYKVADFYQVRMPLFPIDDYCALAQGEPLLSINDPLVQRAIAVGSISLLDELLRDNTTARDQQRRAQKFLRYQIRMTTRPTPYGLFAGVALGRWGEQTNMALHTVASHLHVRPDMEWVLALIWCLESLPQVRFFLNWNANTAVLLRNNRIYVLNPIAAGGDVDLTKVPSIRATQPVRLALSLTRQPLSYQNLHTTLLHQIKNATAEQVTGLLDELWGYGMLLTDLRPTMTGSDNPARTLYERIIPIPLLAPVAEQLDTLLQAIQYWEQAPHQGSADSYRDLTTRMHKVRQDIEHWVKVQQGHEIKSDGQTHDDTQPVLQVDMAHELFGSSINRTVADEATRLANILIQITPPTKNILGHNFKQIFMERYGVNHQVPLLEVLNVHFGPGDPFQVDPQHANPGLSARDRVLLEVATTALHQGQAIIELDDELIARLSEPADLPLSYTPSFDLNLFIAASSKDAVDRGDFRLIVGPNFGARQGGRNMGRFATLVGNEMQESLQDLARCEEQTNTEAIWAEMVYVPYRSRTANVALRPAPRRYEIVFGTPPGVASEQVIPFDEIVISLQNNRFSLHWTRNNREIQVTVGHMLNVTNAPSLVRFLELLSLDDTACAGFFTWGVAEAFPYLPRVQVGKSIVSLARWKVSSKTCKHDLLCTSPTEFHTTLEMWRMHWHVPRYIYLTYADNRLLLDLEAKNHQELLRQELLHLADNQAITLEEAIPAPDDTWVPGPNGRYVLELNVPFIYSSPSPITPPSIHLHPASSETVERYLTPGSEWLFLKLYVSADFQDDVLNGPVRGFMQDLLDEGYIDDWFFIRYTDPDPHLRLRFHGYPDTLLHKVMPLIAQWGAWLLHDGPCVRFTIDGYDREIERYGGPASMLICERLFGIDSRLVLDLLQAQQSVHLDMLLWGAIGLDAMVSSLLETPQQRLDYYNERAAKTNRKATGLLYREHGRELFGILFEPSRWTTTSEREQVLANIRSHSQTMHALSHSLEQMATKGQLHCSYTSLINSLVHMHCNRFFKRNRQNEELVVSLLLRVYESWNARYNKNSAHNK